MRQVWWMALLLLMAGLPSWSVCPPDEAINRICSRLHSEELAILAGSGSSTQIQLDTALLALQVEETRLIYGRKLGLQAEGICADTDVIKARLAYERSQLQLAAKLDRVKDALVVIDHERKLAQMLKQRYCDTLAKRGDAPEQHRPVAHKDDTDIFY